MNARGHRASGSARIAILVAAALLGCSNPLSERPDDTLRFEQLQVSGTTTCGLTGDRQLYCWGQAMGAVMPTDSTADCADRHQRCSPLPVLMPTGLEFEDIDMSPGYRGHLCGLTAGGEVYCWGGMLVTYDAIVSVGYTPGLRGLPRPAVAVSAGRTHDCAVDVAGDMYCWGDYDYNVRATGGPVAHDWDLIPNLVVGGWSFRAAEAGFTNSCGLEQNGEALCWGAPQAVGVTDPPVRTGECGLPAECVDHPVRVAGYRQFTRLVSGGQETCGIDGILRLYCWGPYYPDHTGWRERPEPVETEVPGGVREFAMGGGSRCAISGRGVTYCWGWNWRGRLGVGSEAEWVEEPTPLTSPVAFRSLAVGGLHTCGLDDGGKAWCWGNNRLGQLGTGDTLSRTVPTPVAEPRS